MMKKIGKVTHYFDKLGVAVLSLTSPLAVGDSVKFSGHNIEFTQVVGSMQLDHAPVEKVKKGDDVALKVDQVVKDGMDVEKC